MKAYLSMYDIGNATKPKTPLKNHPGKFRVSKETIETLITNITESYEQESLFRNLVIVKAEYDNLLCTFYYKAYSYLFEEYLVEEHREECEIPWYSFHFSKQTDDKPGQTMISIIAKKIETPDCLPLNWM